MKMSFESEIGAQAPIGYWDPLGLLTKDPTQVSRGGGGGHPAALRRFLCTSCICVWCCCSARYLAMRPVYH